MCIRDSSSAHLDPMPRPSPDQWGCNPGPGVGVATEGRTPIGVQLWESCAVTRAGAWQVSRGPSLW
eukprot:8435015-Alexandrium_andersonii.AAC.1